MSDSAFTRTCLPTDACFVCSVADARFHFRCPECDANTLFCTDCSHSIVCPTPHCGCRATGADMMMNSDFSSPTVDSGAKIRCDDLRKSLVGQRLEAVAQNVQPPRYWAADASGLDVLKLINYIQLPPDATAHLSLCSVLRVALLSFGEAPSAEEKAALRSYEGQRIWMTSSMVGVHEEVVFLYVDWSEQPLGLRPKRPYVLKLFEAVGAARSLIRQLLDSPSSHKVWHCNTPVWIPGTIELVREREHVFASECQGQWVHARKHSDMATAVITFPDRTARDFVLEQISTLGCGICGITVKTKPHVDKRSALEIPEALFACWDKRDGQLSAQALVHFIDGLLEDGHWPGALTREVSFTLNMMSKNSSAWLHVEAQNPNNAVHSRSNRVVVLHLTRRAQNEDVVDTILHSHCLERCRNWMRAYNRDLRPGWANGATLLAPVTLADVNHAGIELRACNIIAYEQDVRNIEDALRIIRDRRRRPKLVQDSELRHRPLCDSCKCWHGSADSEVEIVSHIYTDTDSSFEA